MIETYREAVKFLEKYIPTPKRKHPGELGLRRMQHLAELLGNPQNGFKSVHVGGTSGKGSTATIIASLLATKYKTGLHTSPHLERMTERIQISRFKNIFREVSDKEFINLVNETEPAVKNMEKSRWGSPSYFEIVTAMAFLYFKKQKVDFAVIEVGMGGNFDATNVILPEVAILTNVGLDHTEVLGETVEEIARDKAGIIKRGLVVVTGVKQLTVKKIIKARSEEREVISDFLGKDFKYKIKKITDKGSYFDYFGKKNYRNLYISLLGAHQVENAALAIRAVEQLSEFRSQISEKNLRLGLKNAFIPGRMEVVRKKPLVILDGAHNPDKMKALVSGIKTIWPGRKVVLLLAIKEGKDAAGIVREILPICRKIYLTKYELYIDQGKIRSFETNKLRKIIRDFGFRGEINILKNTKKAITELLKSIHEEDIILFSGSLYFIGGVRNQFL